MYEMYSSYRYFNDEFLFMCLFIYSLCIEVILILFMNVCFSCILSWIICIEFVRKHSTCIWSVTGTIIFFCKQMIVLIYLLVHILKK